MALYERIPAKVEIHEWLGRDAKQEFPKGFDPKITWYQDDGYYWLTTYHGEKSMMAGDYIIKTAEGDYKKLHKSLINVLYRKVE